MIIKRILYLTSTTPNNLRFSNYLNAISFSSTNGKAVNFIQVPLLKSYKERIFVHFRHFVNFTRTSERFFQIWDFL